MSHVTRADNMSSGTPVRGLRWRPPRSQRESAAGVTDEQLLVELRQRANSAEITAESLEANLDRLGKLALLVA